MNKDSPSVIIRQALLKKDQLNNVISDREFIEMDSRREMPRRNPRALAVADTGLGHLMRSVDSCGLVSNSSTNTRAFVASSWHARRDSPHRIRYDANRHTAHRKAPMDTH